MSYRFRQRNQFLSQSRRRNDLAPRPGDRHGDRQDRNKDSVGIPNGAGLSLGSKSDFLERHANKSGGAMHQDGDEK
jgi:hypothetical protein